MFFRFAAALLLVVLVSMTSVRLEKQTLELRRAVSLQHYHCDVLMDMIVQLRLETQQLSATSRTTAGSPGPDRNTARNRMAVTDRRLPAGVAAIAEPATPSEVSPVMSPDRTVPDNAPSRSPRDSSLPLMQFQPPFDPEGID